MAGKSWPVCYGNMLPHFEGHNHWQEHTIIYEEPLLPGSGQTRSLAAAGLSEPSDIWLVLSPHNCQEQRC